MSHYEMIKTQLGHMVPFAKHAGVELLSIDDGVAEAQLEQTDSSINHLKSQHAGALFTLGETASGGAMAGALYSVLMSVKPVAANATIDYKRIAKGTIKAHAKTSRPSRDLLKELQDEGKVQFDVLVDLTDEESRTVAQMTVAWHVRR